jgi:hypothetical protein
LTSALRRVIWRYATGSLAERTERGKRKRQHKGKE